jgi:hypothetical protein
MYGICHLEFHINAHSKEKVRAMSNCFMGICYSELHGYFLFYKSFIINYFNFFQAQNVQVCEIDPEVTSKLKTFRFRKEKNIATVRHCSNLFFDFRKHVHLHIYYIFLNVWNMSS